MYSRDNSGEYCLAHEVIALGRHLHSVKESVKTQKRYMRHLKEKVDENLVVVEGETHEARMNHMDQVEEEESTRLEQTRVIHELSYRLLNVEI